MAKITEFKLVPAEFKLVVFPGLLSVYVRPTMLRI